MPFSKNYPEVRSLLNCFRFPPSVIFLVLTELANFSYRFFIMILQRYVENQMRIRKDSSPNLASTFIKGAG